MLLKIKSFSYKFAIGLRWLIATRDEADYLKEREKLSYGFINNLHSKESSTYKTVVLTDSDYDKSISFAGILSEEYENLIFIHKTQSDNYWICIIKDHAVWNELNLEEKTAGDYICTKEMALKILELAKEEFEKNGIATSTITFASTQAGESFPDLQTVTLSDMIEKSKAHYSKYRILWLQSYRKKIKRLIYISAILVATVSGIAYLYSSQNANAQKRAELLQVELEKQRQAQEKEKYFRELKNNIYQNQIKSGIEHVLQIMSHLEIQSSGWDMTQLTYYASSPYRLDINLKRNSYGDILSFKGSYAAITIKDSIANDNNSGTKTLDFTKYFKNNTPSAPASASALESILKIISSNEPEQRYRLIAIGQKLNLSLQTSTIESSQYGTSKSSYTINGAGLWELRKLTFLFATFSTMTLNNMVMNINNHQITWSIQGEIYG